MKGLLQSKRFKKNLKKWLCMYVGTLGILTCVITYSKYISSLGLNDEARVTKFDVKVKSDMQMVACTTDITQNCCNGSIESENLSCITEDYRPTEAIPYEFIVDYEFEVRTELTLRFYVNKKFTIESLKKDNESLTFTEKEVGDYKEISIKEEFEPKTDKEDKYTITVKYDGYSFNNYTEFKDKVVYVNYYAKQIEMPEKEGN